MRNSIAILVCTSLFGLTGCMSGSDAGLAKSTFDAEVDYRKMALITEHARMRGHDIVWVNPPTKKKSDISTH